MLINKLKLQSAVYKSDISDQENLENMALINNMCSWLKQYIQRFLEFAENTRIKKTRVLLIPELQ